jgi:hypothetical protein
MLPAGRAREVAICIVSIIGITLGGLLLSSCASTGHFIGDHLPEWAGGLPADAPPRRGTPGYETYIQHVDGDQAQPANAAPAQPSTATSPPPATARERIDQPVH